MSDEFFNPHVTRRSVSREMTPEGSLREGFALIVVLILLFAIGVAGATGYQVVNQEARLALQLQEGNQALGIAQAGLYRFLGEPSRGVRDSVQYTLDNGTATVTSRPVLDVSGYERTYLVTSTGTYTDPRISNLPARRTVQQFAVQKQMPFTPIAAVASTASSTNYYNNLYTGPRSTWTVVRGYDMSTTANCAEGGSLDVDGLWAGNGHLTYFTADSLTGSPKVTTGNGGISSLLAATQLDWDLLVDSSYPVDADGTGEWPDFGSIPADSFPVIRINGSFYPGSAYAGRGVLIVRDRFQPADGFNWDGLILAGYADYLYARMTVRGSILTGFSSVVSTTWVYDEANIYFHYCNVLKAASQLTYLEAVTNSWAEVF